MPLSPTEAIVLTTENVAQADTYCSRFDEYLSTHQTAVDTVTRIFLRPLKLDLPPRKVRAEIGRRYREAGWLGAWFEHHDSLTDRFGPYFELFSPSTPSK
jgi:hypothetical protein